MPAVVEQVIPATLADQVAAVAVVHQLAARAVLLHRQGRVTPAVLATVLTMQVVAAAAKQPPDKTHLRLLQAAQAAQAIVPILLGQAQQQPEAAAHILAAVVGLLVIY